LKLVIVSDGLDIGLVSLIDFPVAYWGWWNCRLSRGGRC